MSEQLQNQFPHKHQNLENHQLWQNSALTAAEKPGQERAALAFFRQVLSLGPCSASNGAAHAVHHVPGQLMELGSRTRTLVIYSLSDTGLHLPFRQQIEAIFLACQKLNTRPGVVMRPFNPSTGRGRGMQISVNSKLV